MLKTQHFFSFFDHCWCLYKDLVCSSCFHQLHGRKKSNSCYRIYPPGTLQPGGTAVSALLAVPVHVPGHLHWEPAHDPGHYHRLPPPHAHVLLPLQPVLFRHLFHLHHRPKDAAEHPDAEQSNVLQRLSQPDVLFHAFCRNRQPPLDSDGLWPVRGHLSPIALHGHHEPQVLWHPAPGMLVIEYF